MTELQTLTMTPQKQVVLKTIDELGRKVTAADVSLKSGLPVLKVEVELNEIASETKGNLKVGESGDIVYSFPANFEATYLSRGMELFLQKCGDWFFKVAFFLLRISFGVMLIVSFIVVVLLIMLVILFYSRIGGRSDSDSDDYGDFDGGGWGGGGFHLGFWDWYFIREMLFWNLYARQEDRYSTYDKYNKPSIVKPKNSNFFFNVFSFLFGDGDPNANLEERRWAMIAEAIREKGGAVTAEQLAPYTGSNEEDAMLPVLVRFNGKPYVTESGNIVYDFSSLKATALSPWPGELPTYLNEWTWKFSNVRSDQMLPVYILAALNFLGSWFLFHQMQFIATLATLAPLIHALVIYGTLFLVVPALRAFGLSICNKNIEARNYKRLSYRSVLENPPPELAKKIEEAKSKSFKRDVLTDSDNVYTTEKDLLDQEIDK